MGMVGYFTAIDGTTLEKVKADSNLITEILLPDDDENEPENTVDIDKAWHGIHFMLTSGAADGDGPLFWAVMGGEPIGEDMGYGPARILTPNEVFKISDALTALPIERFLTRFVPSAMTEADIYPEIWSEGQSSLEYLVDNYRRLVAFYKEAAARGDGAILWLA